MTGTGVRVNSVLPGIVDFEANRRAMPKADFAKWPKPDDIARVILFLCSADARIIPGMGGGHRRCRRIAAGARLFDAGPGA